MASPFEGKTMEARVSIRHKSKPISALLPWLVWGVSSLFVTYQMLLQAAPSVMIADLENAFAVNTFGVSLLSSSFFYTYLLFQIPSGMLVDRVHPRNLLIFCLIGIAIATSCFAYSETLPAAHASRILQGIFSAPSVIPALYLAAVWFPAKRFAMLAGLTEMIGMSGAALGQATLAPSVEAFGWRGTLIGCAMVGVAMAVLTFFLVRDKRGSRKTENEIREMRRSVFHNLRIVVSSPQAWVNGLFCGLLFAIAASFGSLWCIPFLMETYSISLDVAASASAMCLFGVACGAPLLGWISDRLKLRKMPMIISTMLVLILILIILYVPAIDLTVMFVLLFALGFFSSIYALSFAVMSDLMPAEVRGTAMGYTNLMCILIGAPILQPLIGWLLNNNLHATANKALAYQHALVVLPISMALGLLLSFFIKETRKNH